ncbi:Uma2 family endonuclease [Leptolyngbya sp. AN02str]|uniref:Uma2 family endonuclease n=1 Tax=Leptolyngbya sp. AN02str TaxID=3423363 RepID=UPI003D31EDC2
MANLNADTIAPPTPIGEKRVTLNNISWESYEKILEALGEGRSARLVYYKGVLEIMTPLEAHDNPSGLIGQFIEILTEELDFTLKTMESTTLNRPDLATGAEPDKGYYIQNEPLVRGKIVDLAINPPPDLVLEVDITNTDLNKNKIYAALGVPELWRFNGRVLKIYQLQAEEYQEVETSPTFPNVPKERLYQFLNECAQLGETQAKRNLRQLLSNKTVG